MARRISGRSHGDPRAADTRRGPRDQYRPSRDEILRYIAENPDRSGKREIAKAFALRGDDRVWLKDLLRDLQDEGLLEQKRKRHIRPGALPHVTVLDVIGRDDQGGLIGRPAEHQGNGEPPVVSIRASRGGPVAGIGDRVLAKTFPTDEVSGLAYTARIMKVFEKRSDAVLGIFRVLKDGTFRIEPVERRQPELLSLDHKSRRQLCSV